MKTPSVTDPLGSYLSMCITDVYNGRMKTSHKRINITLPAATVAMLEQAADKGSRSNFIDAAIRKHVSETRKQNLREEIKAGAIANAERDLEIAKEWFEIDTELWPDY